jgi:hypothetical protein
MGLQSRSYVQPPRAPHPALPRKRARENSAALIRPTPDHCPDASISAISTSKARVGEPYRPAVDQDLEAAELRPRGRGHRGEIRADG